MPSYPSLTSNTFLETIKLHVLPEAVIILYTGLGSDRLRRIQYSDISRICVGRATPVPVMVTAAIFMVIGGLMLAARGGFFIIGAAILAVATAVFIESLVSRQTILEIHSLGAKIRFRKHALSKKKTRKIVDAILDNIEQAQGTKPEPAFSRPVRESPVFTIGEE